MTNIRTLDLFCGAGGSSWGAASGGADIVCGVDAWVVATQTYALNFPKAKAINLTLDESSCPKSLGNIGDIDLLLASPECTNHTCAKGSRPRDEGSKLTARYVLNFAKTLKPRWVVVENVVHMKKWHGYDTLIKDLTNMKYHVRPQVIDAATLGVPQKRRRLFLICDRLKMPSEIIIPEVLGKKAKDIIDPPGIWKSSLLYNGKRAQNTIDRAERAISTLGKGVPFLIVYYGSDGSGGWQPLDRPLRTLTTLDRFGLVTWEGRTPFLRMLQVPELLKAMGFSPEFHPAVGTRRDKIRLLGNGVCPPVMEAIVRSLTSGRSSRSASCEITYELCDSVLNNQTKNIPIAVC